jgi:hypothetical protein
MKASPHAGASADKQKLACPLGVHACPLGVPLGVLRERTYAGLAATSARGRRGGGQKHGDEQRADAVDLYRRKRHTIDETSVSRAYHERWRELFSHPFGSRIV